MTVSGTYNGALVGLSILISTVASYTALDLAGRMRPPRGGARLRWLCAAAAAMGAGIWSMHFVAMLAFMMPMPMSYDIGLTVLSLAVAVAATGIGFIVVGRDAGRSGGMPPILISGVLMGIGIAAMHYIGMAAMRMPASVQYDPVLAALSVAIAIGASTVGLQLAFHTEAIAHRGAAALLMGAAICGMHYTGMAAAVFHPHPDSMAPIAGTGRLDPELLAVAVAAMTLLILLLALLASAFDRRFAALAEQDAAALRESERRFRAYFDHAPERLFIVEVGLDGVFRYDMFNPASERLGGVPSDEARGRTPHDLLPPDVADQFVANYRRCVEAGKPLCYEEVISLASGARTWETILVPLRDAEGRIVKLMGSARDITDRKQAEERLRHSQKIEAIGQLTGGVAHDFNNLLTAVLGNLSLAERGESDPAKLMLLRNAARAAERGARLTQQLLAFSRKQHFDAQLVDMNALIGEMSDILFRTIGTIVQIETVLADGLWPTVVDPTQIEMVVLNLAINARDAMPIGGRLQIETANISDTHPKRPEGLPPGDYIMVAVSDTGAGMPEEVRARAFEPFFTTKEVGKGSGLGLSQVYGVAAQSGGTARIFSTVGQGTTVQVFLPRAQPQAVDMREGMAAEVPVAAAAGGGGGSGIATILVVDDDRLVRAFTATCLRGLGYAVIEAESGWVALDILARPEPIDLLVTDVAMPGLRGTEVADLAAAQRPGLRTLFLTGFTDPAMHDQRLRGAHILKKPFRPEQLAASIRGVLGGGKSGAAKGESGGAAGYGKVVQLHAASRARHDGTSGDDTVH